MSRTGRRTRPTRAVPATLAAGLLLLALSGSTHDGWLVLLAGLALGVVVAAFVLRPPLDALDVVVHPARRAVVGEPLTATVTVSNASPRALPPSTLTLHAPGLTAVSVAVPALAAGATADATVTFTAVARGVVTEVTADLRTTAPLGVVAVHARRSAPCAVIVRPALEQPLPTAPAGTGGASDIAVPGPGLGVHGIREWRRGEPVGRLHARGTARHGRPLVLDRHDDADHGLAVVVGGAPEHPLFESLVSTVAGTVVAAGRAGRPVVVAAAQPGLEPVRSTDPDTLLDWCARLLAPAPPDGATVTAAIAALGQGGSVVVADTTWTQDAAWWRGCVAAADAAGVGLSLLHPIDGRTDALCLHDAHGGAHR